MSVRRSLVICIITAWLAPVATAQPDAPAATLPKPLLRDIEKLAGALARKGRAAEALETVQLLERLGYESTGLEKLGNAIRTKPGGRRAKSTKAEARKAEAIARRIARLVAEAGNPDRVNLARIALYFDSDIEEVHRALGHTRTDGVWRSESERKRLRRRADIQAALQRARRLPVALDVSDSTDPVFRFFGRPAIAVRFRELTLYTDIGHGRAVSLMRAALRASALSAFIRGKPLQLPACSSKQHIVLVRTRESYLELIEELVKRGQIAGDKRAQLEKQAYFYLDKPFEPGFVISDVREYEAFSLSFSFLTLDLSAAWKRAEGRAVQPCLHFGHLSWVCLAYLGAEAPLLCGEEVDEKQIAARYPDAVHGPGWQRVKHLRGAGLEGTRAWLRYMAHHRADPAWSHSMVSKAVKLSAVDVLKSTYVVEYLQEEGRFVELLAKSAIEHGSSAMRAKMEAALGETLGAFDERWRKWLIGRSAGLKQRLAPTDARSVAPQAAKALSYLQRIRSAAFAPRLTTTTTLEIEPTLSSGTLAHARYLAKNRAQLAKWPDAHEQYPDREGFSPAGSWAGQHSVIAPGVRKPEEAIDGWIGTFYHRLPLLDPCLLRIGWGMHDGIAVLDASSVSNPSLVRGWVAWPPPRMRSVPTAFQPELPNPVPGVDQSGMGYPITLQYFGWSTEASATMTLHHGGSPSAPQVECWVITPAAPINRELVPPGAYCLIPKTPLKRSSRYTVVADLSGSDEPWVWTFSTR